MKNLRYIFLIAIAVTFFSCNKFKGSQEIPAYLRIEPWTLTTNYEIEGAATEAITDAWVYINGNLHGCFEFKNHDTISSPTITSGMIMESQDFNFRTFHSPFSSLTIST